MPGFRAESSSQDPIKCGWIRFKWNSGWNASFTSRVRSCSLPSTSTLGERVSHLSSQLRRGKEAVWYDKNKKKKDTKKKEGIPLLHYQYYKNSNLKINEDKNISLSVIP